MHVFLLHKVEYIFAQSLCPPIRRRIQNFQPITMNSIHSDGFDPIQRIQCIPIFGFNPFWENSFTRSSGQSYASCKPRSSPAQAKDFKANILHTLDIELRLKGLFTIFFLSLKSHILDTNGVWYSWFWSEGSVNSPN